MVRTINTALLGILLFLPVQNTSSQCLYNDDQWQNQTRVKQQRLLHAPSLPGMNSDCFVAFLHRYSQEVHTPEKSATLLVFLREYCKKARSFNPAMLHAFLNSIDTADHTRLSADIIKLWETYNRSLWLLVKRMERAGLFTQADSLYQDIMKLSLLEVNDLLEWGRIKGVLGDFSGAAQILCKASLKDKAMVNPSLNQLKRALADISSSETKREALQLFSECYQSHAGANLDSLSRWLSAAYAHCKLYRDEELAITRFDKSPQSKGKRLLQTALQRFADNLFSEALPAAKKAWRYISEEPPRQKCAIILYQSYLQTGKSDSALVWLDKVNLTNQYSRANAVVLYQNSGFPQKADSILSTLKESVTKDTLTVRQHLFAGSVNEARSYISACTKDSLWDSAKCDIFLWQIRCAVYTGSLSQAALSLDSLHRIGYPPSWTYTSEILTTQLAMKRLGMFPDAFAYWGKLRYAIFVNKPHKPVSAFTVKQWPEPLQEYLTSTLVDALITNELFDRAQLILDKVPRLSTSPQITYYRALVSSMLGYSDKARALFEKIILASPDDVFAQKARIYLLKLKEFHSM